MKILVIGIGRCGGKIADEFERLNGQARRRRSLEFVSGTFAVDTDAEDLVALSNIEVDYKRRILIGAQKTRGQGLGGANELGAKIASEDAHKLIDSVKEVRDFFETDAFLLIAGAAGGTGSGAVSVLSNLLKQVYPDKRVYGVVVLPFEDESGMEARAVYNAAVCLKSTYSAADAVLLIDSQRFVRKDASLRRNLEELNRLIVEPFYNLLCAGEEKRRNHIGTKVIDAGDIMQTLSGWTVIGYGKTDIGPVKLPFMGKGDFVKRSRESYTGIRVMEQALSELYLQCNPKNAARALYLISASHDELNVNLIREIGERLKTVAPNAVIRSGDYPVERGFVDMTIILSELTDLNIVREYYRRSISAAEEIKRKAATPAPGTEAAKNTAESVIGNPPANAPGEVTENVAGESAGNPPETKPG